MRERHQARAWPWQAEPQAAPPEGSGVPGRPVGSLNKRTRQLAMYLAARGFKDPAVGLASVVSSDWAALAKALGCSVKDAADFWRACSVDLLPYIHQKRPIAVEHEAPDAGELSPKQLAEAIIRGARELLRSQAVIDGQAVEVGSVEVGKSGGSADG